MTGKHIPESGARTATARFIKTRLPKLGGLGVNGGQD